MVVALGAPSYGIVGDSVVAHCLEESTTVSDTMDTSGKVPK